MALKGIIFYCALSVICSFISCDVANTDDVQVQDNELKGVTIPKFPCSSLNGLFPHPTDCRKYYLCRLGVANELECSGNMYYDKVIEVCRDKSKVKCDKDGGDPEPTTEEPTKDRKFKCPKPWGTFLDSTDCSKYYVCAFNLPTSFQCRQSQLFDVVTQRCMPRDIVDCLDRWDKDEVTTTTITTETSTEEEVTTTTITTETSTEEPFKQEGVLIPKFFCPSLYGLYPHPTDCRKYYLCRWGLAYELECSRNKYFDKVMEVCRDKSKVKCDKDGVDPEPTPEPTTEKPSKKDFKCPNAWGYFPDPTDCSKYYVCAFNLPTSFQCRKSQLFDVVTKKCKKRDLVDCLDRWDKDEITTTTITTETTETSTEEPFKEGKFKFFCPFRQGRYADRNDCAQYYECRFFFAWPHRCPRSTLYDERREECVEAKNARCGNRPGGSGKEPKPEVIKCPYVFGTFPHPTDCSKYMICLYNVPTIIPCRRFELFNVFSRRCAGKDGINCQNRKNPDDLDPVTTSTTPEVTDPTTTTKESTITEEPTPTESTTTDTPTITEPTPTVTEDTTTVTNVPPPNDCEEGDVECIIDETGGDISKWFTCPERYGQFPHLGSRELFIYCSNWKPAIKRCASGTYFSLTYLVCSASDM